MNYQEIKKQIKRSKISWIVKYAKGVLELKDRMAAKKWTEKSIVYFTGHTMYEWSPDSLKTGIGGSETAVINLARKWVKLGYSVTIYGSFGKSAGIYDGVNYRLYTEFNKYDIFDTLIVWRRVDHISFSYRANRVWFDVHDVLYKDQFNDQNLRNIDTIFFKSNYQRRLLPQVTKDQFVIIPNGVDQSLLDLDLIRKDPYKLIYASNYQRGLELMLVHGWPIIKKEIQEAVLHVYYGWNFTDLMYGKDLEYLIWKDKMIDLMSQPGVIEHGRVGQSELIAEKATAVIHYYATNFEEIDAISLKESAMVGCLPICSDYAALSEKEYCLKSSGDPNDKSTQEAIARRVIELLKDRVKLEELSQRSKEAARTETWDNVAKLWIEQMKE